MNCMEEVDSERIKGDVSTTFSGDFQNITLFSPSVGKPKGRKLGFLCTLLLLEVMVSNLNFIQWGEFCDNVIIRE